MSTMTAGGEQELIAAGSSQAFEELYQYYHARVYSLCLRMTRNVWESEDLTQEVFIQLFRKIGSFRGESSFATWLHRLTVNQVLMHFRKRRVKLEQTTESGATPVQTVKGTENPRLMSVVDNIALAEAITRLAPGYRSVFLLHDVEGYQHGEIARLLGCSTGTSKSQLHKARMKLRKLLSRRTPPRLPYRDNNLRAILFRRKITTFNGNIPTDTKVSVYEGEQVKLDQLKIQRA